jgi:UDP-glucose 4-epimerase
MRAIITGIDGFVGSSVAKELLCNGWSVVGIDLGAQSHSISPNPNFQYFQTNGENVDEVCEKIASLGQGSVFYHFAWRGVSGPDRSDEKIQLNNVQLTIEWLRAAHKIGCIKFISSGSIMEFETNQVIYEQSTKPGLGYVYGSAKIAAHGMCKSIANSLGISLIWAYITNTYGVGERSQRMLNTTLRKIIHNEPLEFTEGTQNYDFIYISDVALAFRLIGEKGLPNKGYVIGSGHPKALRDFLEELLNETRPTNRVSFGAVPYSGVQTPLSYFDITDLSRDTGFCPRVSFSSGVRKTLEWLKSTEKNAN